jgi:hypothetical protein
VLLDVAAAADLLVVGSRGHGEFAGALLGSVSQNCAHHASCPVLIMHGESGQSALLPPSGEGRTGPKCGAGLPRLGGPGGHWSPDRVPHHSPFGIMNVFFSLALASAPRGPGG